MNFVAWIPWTVVLDLVCKSRNCDAQRAGTILYDHLTSGALVGAGDVTTSELWNAGEVDPEQSSPDWQPEEVIERSLWRLGEWLASVPALKLPDRVISNLHVDHVALARLIDCAAPAPPAAVKVSSKKRAAPRSEFESPTRALKFNRKWKYQPKALRERMKRELLATLWDARGPDGRREMARQWDDQHDPPGEPDRQKMFDLLDRQAALKVKIAAASDDASLADFENELTHVDADIFESVNKPDDNVLRDTHRFLEIAEAVARLNQPVTSARAMELLIKSFEKGEFDRDDESGVYQGGKRLSREFHEKAKATPEADRGNTCNPTVYRISKATLTDWAQRWRFSLAPGFTTTTAAEPEEQSVAPAKGDAPAVTKAASPRRRAGRPAEWDWSAAMANLTAIANSPDGLPDVQADAERMVEKYFADRNDGRSPALSAIREKVSEVYAAVAYMRGQREQGRKSTGRL